MTMLLRLCLLQLLRATAGYSGAAVRPVTIDSAALARRSVPVECSLLEGLKKAAADFDEAAWDMFQGRKERIWSPDRRPLDERGRFDFTKSTLSWGQSGNEITEEVAETLRIIAETKPDEISAQGDAMLLGDGRGGLVGELAGKLAREEQVPVNPEARETNGRELAELCFDKYGRYHDMTLLRNKVFDGQWQVAFNIYGPCLGQRSFSYTEQQYLDKLDTAALMLRQVLQPHPHKFPIDHTAFLPIGHTPFSPLTTRHVLPQSLPRICSHRVFCSNLTSSSWDQAWFVKQFLCEPVRPRAGLPSRPRPDSAVTLRLNNSPTWRDVDPLEVDEWFTVTGLGG